MKRVILLCISLLPDEGKQGKGGKRSGAKCTSSRAFSASKRESRGICVQLALGRRNPSVAVASTTDISDSLVRLLLPICHLHLYLVLLCHWSSSYILMEVLKGSPRPGRVESGKKRSWTLVLPFPTVPATQSPFLPPKRC